MNRYYAGVGSRQTPEHICNVFTNIAIDLRATHSLRSGGADGADNAFELGAGDNKHIWLPWKKFNKNQSKLIFENKKATEILKTVISADHFSKLTDPAVRLHSRNVHQVMGNLVDEPYSEFVLCWTLDAQDNMGGTATAIKLAKQLDIPVYNFGKCVTVDDAYRQWERIKILENIS